MGTKIPVSYTHLDVYKRQVLQIYFDTDPAKRAKMTDIILNELNQFVDQGPSAENLNKVKAVSYTHLDVYKRQVLHNRTNPLNHQPEKT